MHPTYKHTQIGYFTMLLLFLTGLLISPVLIRLLDEGRNLLTIGIVAFFLLILGLFSTFTIEVSTHHLSFWFGFRALGKKYSLREIQDTQSVQNPWYYLWGIKTIPGGWLYAIAPGKALEIVLKSGKRVRLGTAQPEQLKIVLEEALAGI